MREDSVRLRLQMATLKGFCQSAEALSEYDVPEDWIVKLIAHAERCENLVKAVIYAKPSDEATK